MSFSDGNQCADGVTTESMIEFNVRNNLHVLFFHLIFDTNRRMLEARHWILTTSAIFAVILLPNQYVVIL